MQKIFGWSRASSSYSKLFHPETILDLNNIISLARENNSNICMMGSGNSYGDEFQNDQNIVINTTKMNKIIGWDSTSGIIEVEPGVTLTDILKICLLDSWIIPVVPGVRSPTIGGCIANNIHGKNCYIDGNIGDWVLEFDILLSSGEIITCSNKLNNELFYSAIGGIGLLGIFTRIRIQLKKVSSSNVRVKKITASNVKMMLDYIYNQSLNEDYVIGQMDTFISGACLGRGSIHVAKHIINRNNSLEVTKGIDLNKYLFHFIPRTWFIYFGKLFISSYFMRFISAIKYYLDYLTSNKAGHVESFAQFNFLIDRIPNWPKIFKYGFYEIEPLIPFSKTEEVIKDIINISHRYKLPAYLAGVKLHKKDNFLLSYSLNGYSVGFDFPIEYSRIKVQKKMFEEIHNIIINAKGLIYLAKDNLIKPHQFKKMYSGKLEDFIEIKKKYDPTELFQSNIYRRLFI
jgi:decaprenylphospho-beta-D-ribofuranose 2-oxidase